MTSTNRCLPVGSLPYADIKAATKMMVKLFEHIPYLPDFPVVNKNETLLGRTLCGAPGILFHDSKIIFNAESKTLSDRLAQLDIAYNNPDEDNVEPYTFNVFFMEKYFQIIERIKPKRAVINFMGPFSAIQKIASRNGAPVICDKYCRKSLIQTICVKAIWIVSIIKLISPETIPIVILDEPLLHKLGNIKRENEEINNELIINMFSKIIDNLHNYGAKVGIQCFEKCDWSIPIDAGVDLISFDAYDNPNNLNIIAEKVNNFLAKGGIINWAMVPVKNETIVKACNADILFDKFIKTIEEFIESGVSEKLAYNRAMVSLQGDISHLPLIFAEKALIIANQLAKRIPVKR